MKREKNRAHRQGGREKFSSRELRPVLARLPAGVAKICTWSTWSAVRNDSVSVGLLHQHATRIDAPAEMDEADAKEGATIQALGDVRASVPIAENLVGAGAHPASGSLGKEGCACLHASPGSTTLSYRLRAQERRRAEEGACSRQRIRSRSNQWARRARR